MKKIIRLIISCQIALLGLVFICFSNTIVNAQMTLDLSPTPDIDISVDCIDIEVGERVTFVRNSDCGPNMEVRTGDENSPIVVFSSEKISAPYVFNDEGLYLVSCGGSPSGVSFNPSRLKSIAVCINVVDPALISIVGPTVPTMGEWALICCGLLIAICGVVSLKQRTISVLN